MYGAGDVRVESVPDAHLVQSTDAVVRVTRAAICGSDLWPYKSMPRSDGAMIELGLTQVGEIDRVPLRPNLERVVPEVRRHLGGTALDAAPACNSRGQGCLTAWVRPDQY